MPNVISKKLQPFIFHGVHLEPSGNNHIGDCPFCDKEGHFFVNPESGQWDCKVCGEAGNVISFLQKFYELALELTPDEYYEELSEDRCIPVAELKSWGLAWHYLNDVWIIPGVGLRGKINNLYVYEEGGKVFGTKGIDLGMTLHKNADFSKCNTVYFCEGPFDGISLHAFLSRYKLKPMKKGDTTHGDSHHPLAVPGPITLHATHGPDANFPDATPASQATNPLTLIRTTKQGESLLQGSCVVIIPGTNNFKKPWADHFKGKVVRILFDNDHPRKHRTRTSQPGWDGTQRTAKLLLPVAKQVDILQWGKDGHDPSLPDGYDLRDSFKPIHRIGTNGEVPPTPDRARDLLVFFQNRLVTLEKSPDIDSTKPDTQSTIEPTSCESFKELCKQYEGRLHFSDTMRRCLAVMLAVTVSTKLKRDHVWLRVIGPPGSGKTTLAEAISCAREYCYPLDILTRLSSGYVDPHDKKKDSSLFDHMRDRTTIIKDGDTIVSSSNKGELLSHFRGLYDGTLRAHYGNLKKTDPGDVRTTVIICGTDELRRVDQSQLGDRFLDIEIIDDINDQDHLLTSAMMHTMNGIIAGYGEDQDTDDTLKARTYGYLKFLKDKIEKTPPPLLNQETMDLIEALGNFVSYLRSRPRKDVKADYRSRREVATRLVSQLTKLAMCLTVVMDDQGYTPEIHTILRKVALDTAQGFQLEIVECLYNHPNTSVKQMEHSLSISEGTIRTITTHLREIEGVKRTPKANSTGRSGRHVHLLRLTDKLSNICDYVFV